MSHFTTKCHYTTASLQHRMSFRNAHPITSSNLRCSSCSCLCFSHRQEAAAKANSLTCRFYTVIDLLQLSRHINLFIIYFGDLSVSAHSTTYLLCNLRQVASTLWALIINWKNKDSVSFTNLNQGCWETQMKQEIIQWTIMWYNVSPQLG